MIVLVNFTALSIVCKLAFGGILSFSLSFSSRKPCGSAIGALRKLLVEKNTLEFQNPSDPTTINVMRAFLKYDKDRLVHARGIVQKVVWFQTPISFCSASSVLD